MEGCDFAIVCALGIAAGFALLAWGLFAPEVSDFKRLK